VVYYSGCSEMYVGVLVYYCRFCGVLVVILVGEVVVVV